MPVIRPATEADISAIVETGARFHDVAGWSDIASYDAEDCARSIGAMMSNGSGVFLVAEDAGKIVGIAGGVVYPLYFNAGHQSGQELFLWVDPERRDGLGGSMLTALEAAARDAGCDSWAMIALDMMRPRETGLLYQRRGYRPSEHSWIRSL